METITRACQAENLDIEGYCGERRTDAHSVVAVRLLEEAVEFAHLAQGCLTETLGGYNRLYLISQRLDVFTKPS